MGLTHDNYCWFLLLVHRCQYYLHDQWGFFFSLQQVPKLWLEAKGSQKQKQNITQVCGALTWLSCTTFLFVGSVDPKCCSQKVGS